MVCFFVGDTHAQRGYRVHFLPRAFHLTNETTPLDALRDHDLLQLQHVHHEIHGRCVHCAILLLLHQSNSDC